MIYQVTYTVTKDFTNPKEAATYFAKLQRQPSIYKDAKTTFITEPNKDAFLDFLDNNPANPTEERKELTKAQQEAIWQADWDAENRRIQEDNLFYNS